MNESEYDELKRLRAENIRLRDLLAHYGIATDEPAPSITQKPSLSLEEKVNLFAVCFRDARMCSLGDGSVPLLARAATSLCAVGNGTVNIATRRSINVPNVRTANFNLLGIMIFIGILKVRIPMNVMWLESMQFLRTTRAIFFVATSMTRAASMDIKMM